ncbi:glycosyltransferase family 2 protein [Candidatus Micrarchaeota archaeon]|nr:glycosyltransferase family 2 protein [Candidatus Micrarchaeota archaeon]
MYKKQKVSVVFPAYNEEEGIAKAVADFSSQPCVDEVIVVDNNSSDRTAEFAKKAGAKVITETKQGYGNAIQRGLREANGDIVIVAEPDGTFIARDVEKLLAYINDFEFVLGSRINSSLVWEGANMGLFLKWGNWFIAKLIQFLYGGPALTDVGCTLRAIRRGALEKIQGRFSVGGSAFSPEMIVLALKAGVRTMEVPVNYLPRLGKSKITGDKVKAFRLGLRMIWLIFSRKFS